MVVRPGSRPSVIGLTPILAEVPLFKTVVMAEAPVDDRYTLNDNIKVVLPDSQLFFLLSANDPLQGGWRGWASRLNYNHEDLCKFVRETDPCRAVLEDWQKKPGSTIRAFLHAFQHRHDIQIRLQQLMRGEALLFLRLLLIIIINIIIIMFYTQLLCY